jgi:hypothetical protein
MGVEAGVVGGVGKGVGNQIWQQTPALHHLVHVINIR